MNSLEPGALLDPMTFSVDRETLVRYAGAASDFAPIHYNDDAARASGLPGVIAHGMLSSALVAQAVDRWVGSASSVTEMSNRFIAVVPVEGLRPTMLTISGTVVEASGGSATIGVEATLDGRPVLANVRVRVHRDGPTRSREAGNE